MGSQNVWSWVANVSTLFLLQEWTEYPLLCQTPRYEQGMCVNLKSCAIAMEYLMTRNPLYINYVQKLQCGFYGLTGLKVCCPYMGSENLLDNDLSEIDEHNGELGIDEESTTCTTPRSEPGSCINIKKCSSAIKLLKSFNSDDLEYLRSLQCGFDGPRTPKVCCANTSATKNKVVTEPPNVSKHPNLEKINQECGSIVSDRIVGGQKTTINQYPWMVLISYAVDNGREFECGGSLITDQFVLTAAHCLSNLKNKKIVGVRLGEHTISTKPDCQSFKLANGTEYRDCTDKVQDMKIDKIIVHPDYDATNVSSPDIGLIKVQGHADVTRRNIATICLPVAESRYFTQKNVIVAGWGRTESGMTSDDLLQVKLPILTNAQCEDIYKGKPYITDRQVCAGGDAAKGHDSCAGDSGGPMMSAETLNNNAVLVQQGIVSFGPRFCGLDSRPGVYTRVAYYMDWILDQIN